MSNGVAESNNTTYILLWNPKTSDYTKDDLDYEKEIIELGETIEDNLWSLGCTDKPKVGDRYFIKQAGKGIIGSGYFLSNVKSYTDDNGKKYRYIEIKNEILLNSDKEKYLTIDELSNESKSEINTMMSSGRGCSDNCAKELIEKWDELISKYGYRARFKRRAKNTILYGPPGTGKTYNTVYYALAICNGLELEEQIQRCEEKAKETGLKLISGYDIALQEYNALIKEGRIAFTTFHQSYGYEEFIEGIKPIVEDSGEEYTDSSVSNANTGNNNSEVKYSVIPGVFKQFCEQATHPLTVEKKNNTVVMGSSNVWKVTVRQGVKQDCFDKDRVRINYSFTNGASYGFRYSIKKDDIIITTDGSRSNITGIALVTKDEVDDLSQEFPNDVMSRSVKWLAKDIYENILPYNSNLRLQRRTFARVPNANVSGIIELARKLNPKNALFKDTMMVDNIKPYVFIIDEINRGNISKIFGELITLIEDSKRIGAKEEMRVKLAYSHDQDESKGFGVPNNVYILGTMNTADRSLALMDTALRRRFDFIEMLPNAQLLPEISIGDTKINLCEMLNTINQRIEYLYDREHTIGHAFFMSLKEKSTIDELAKIFSRKVIPLLQEYFYDDYEKIQLVLGDNDKTSDTYKFILAEKRLAKNIFKKNFAMIESQTIKYTINNEALKYVESYKEIGEGI